MIVGFVGLGIMGKPMCRNLMRAGYATVVYDLNGEPVRALEAEGARTAGSAGEVAAQSDVVVTMLPNSPHVKAAVLGPQGVLEGAKPGLVLIDMSSIAPLASREVEAACRAKGVAMLDAPVSGGEPKAVDGTLSIMVGDEEALFEKMRPLLLCMGASAVYCGEIGAGNTTKLANQVIVAANIAACAEGLMLARRAGVDPARVFEAIRGGLAGSTVMNAKAPMMLAGAYAPGFRVDLHIKDLQNALDIGRADGSPLPLSAQVMEMLQWLHAHGAGQEDHSALVKFYEALSGQTLGA